MDSVIPGGRYHNFKDFISFPNVGKANLVNWPLPRLRHVWFDKFHNTFDAIRHHDILFYFPYPHISHVLELLRRTSFDPNVLSVKINIYLVAKDSHIIDAMIHAAHNGKSDRGGRAYRPASTKRRIFIWSSGLPKPGCTLFSLCLG